METSNRKKLILTLPWYQVWTRFSLRHPMSPKDVLKWWLCRPRKVCCLSVWQVDAVMGTFQILYVSLQSHGHGRFLRFWNRLISPLFFNFLMFCCNGDNLFVSGIILGYPKLQISCECHNNAYFRNNFLAILTFLRCQMNLDFWSMRSFVTDW